jgi:hypothetical protein
LNIAELADGWGVKALFRVTRGFSGRQKSQKSFFVEYKSHKNHKSDLYIPDLTGYRAYSMEY